MAITITATPLNGVRVIEPAVFGDERGFFLESFNAREFAEQVDAEAQFVQDNHSRSARHVLRGLHYQTERPQGKLVRAVVGEIFDVAVDLRAGSPTLGQWFGTTLSADNKRQLWIPGGFAHGFLVLSEAAEVLYKTTDYWYPKLERSLRWDDPSIGIAWPVTAPPTLSKKDAEATGISDATLYLP